MSNPQTELDQDETDVFPDVEDVDTPEDETDSPAGESKPPKTEKVPARGDLPEGYVTPVGLAKLLNEDLSKYSSTGNAITPQMVYSYIKNAPKDHPFPITEVTDSLGKSRQALLATDGLTWWEEKNARVAARKSNAAKKAADKEASAAKKEASTPTTATEGAEQEAGPVDEAE
jgi:hypothetical protein